MTKNRSIKIDQEGFFKNKTSRDFPGGAVDRNLPASAGDPGSIPIREDPTFRGATKPVSHNY